MSVDTTDVSCGLRRGRARVRSAALWAAESAHDGRPWRCDTAARRAAFRTRARRAGWLGMRSDRGRTSVGLDTSC